MLPRVTFATSCWERDWRRILVHPDYLEKLQIAHQCFPFFETFLIINNVDDLEIVQKAAQKKVDCNVLTRYVIARDVLSHFGLKTSDFTEWQYYNALAPLMAIHEAKGDYLLYLTGDVYLKEPVSWIEKAIRFMEKTSIVKVANLTWNDNYHEARKEAYRRTWNFFVARQGFSDQMFLVRREDFNQPIYGERREDASHYPRGAVLEQRIFCYMKNRGWERITYRHGAYTHENGDFFEGELRAT